MRDITSHGRHPPRAGITTLAEDVKRHGRIRGVEHELVGPRLPLKTTTLRQSALDQIARSTTHGRRFSR